MKKFLQWIKHDAIPWLTITRNKQMNDYDANDFVEFSESIPMEDFMKELEEDKNSDK